MRNLVLVLMMLGLAAKGVAQSHCFTVDSIPVSHFVRFVYHPKDSSQTLRSFDVINHKNYGLIISYTVPIIWVGVEVHEFEPRFVDDSLRLKLDILLCKGQELPINEARRKIGKWSKLILQKGVANVEPNLFWEKLFMEIEVEQFGDQIDEGLRYQRDYLRKIAKYVPGCYYIKNTKSIPLLSDKIKLKQIHSENEFRADRCYWCFLRDKVVMSGPCYQGIEMTFNWELRQAPGYQYLCLLNGNSHEECETCLYKFDRTSLSENQMILESLEKVHYRFYPSILYESPALLIERGYNAVD